MIKDVKHGIFDLENIRSGDKFKTDREAVDKHFRYDYCITCHSAQGATIKKTITIHEWELSHLVSREWIWTAITRADGFRKVKICSEWQG